MAYWHSLNTSVRIIRTPFRAPICNAYAERFVRSIKEECLERMILIGSGIFDARLPSSSPTTMQSAIIKASVKTWLSRSSEPKTRDSFGVVNGSMACARHVDARQCFGFGLKTV